MAKPKKNLQPAALTAGQEAVVAPEGTMIEIAPGCYGFEGFRLEDAAPGEWPEPSPLKVSFATADVLLYWENLSGACMAKGTDIIEFLLSRGHSKRVAYWTIYDMIRKGRFSQVMPWYFSPYDTNWGRYRNLHLIPSKTFWERVPPTLSGLADMADFVPALPATYGMPVPIFDPAKGTLAFKENEARCGIESPRFLWWQGKRYEIELEGKPWDLLVYLWGKPYAELCDIASAVWNKKGMTYCSMKPSVTRLNQAIGRAGLPFTWTKPRRENRLVYGGPSVTDSVSR